MTSFKLKNSEKQLIKTGIKFKSNKETILSYLLKCKTAEKEMEAVEFEQWQCGQQQSLETQDIEISTSYCVMETAKPNLEDQSWVTV